MSKWYLSILLICLNVSADQFFDEQSLVNNTDTEIDFDLAKKSEKLTTCPISKNSFSLNLPTEFEKLKLIGLIEINGNFRALFIDDKNQLFDLKENELINNYQIEIKNINLKSVTYINWKLTKDCNSPYEIKLKL